MKSLRWLILLFFLTTIALISNAAAETSAASPEAVTKALYHSDLKNMGFSPETIKTSRRGSPPISTPAFGRK
jgi:hypothetical protein